MLGRCLGGDNGLTVIDELVACLGSELKFTF
jgi:hypothetical protein